MENETTASIPKKNDLQPPPKKKKIENTINTDNHHNYCKKEDILYAQLR